MSEFEYGILFSSLVIISVLFLIEYFSGDVTKKFILGDKGVHTVVSVECKCGSNRPYVIGSDSPQKCPSCGGTFLLQVSYKIKEIRIWKK